MEIPLLLLYKILQLFAVMVLGFALVKIRVLRPEDSLALSRISLYILMPMAIISSFNVELNSEIVSGILLSFGAGIVLHLLLLLIDKLFSKISGASPVERASMFYSNAANLIIPIVSSVLGDEWVIYSLGFMSVQLVFLWSHGVAVFNPGEGVKIKKLLFNPTILSIILGLILLFSGIRLPAFISDITSSFGNVLGYVGMLVAGITAAGINFKKMLKNKRIYLISAMRLLVYPLIALLVIRLALFFIQIPNAKSILLITFLAIVTPTASSVMQMSQLYDTECELAVAINIFTTVVSCITIPLFVTVYQMIIT